MKIYLSAGWSYQYVSLSIPVTEMRQDRADMPSHLLSLEKKNLKILSQK